MESLKEKYAEVLLKTCLKVENQPLLISFNSERLDFVRIITKIAYKMGVTDIYYDITDPYLKHEALLNLPVEKLKKLSFFDKTKWSEYAKKNAAFLMLASENPGLMDDVDPVKIKELIKFSNDTRKDFLFLRDKLQLSWCIAAVPTKSWAKLIFKTSENPVDDLWMKIFDICEINSVDPKLVWDKKIKILSKRAKKLNDYNFKTLKYKNGKGTCFSVSLPKGHIWQSGSETLENGKEILVNFPTEEVFTSPDYRSANGILYSSKPLSYQGNIIDNFNITFKDGKAVSSYAEIGDKFLKEMINTCNNSNYLGEVALVESSSQISVTGLTFYETLYDENASCHFALGASFKECIINGVNISKEELQEVGLNQCDNHVDFMVGTPDLEIIGITENNDSIKIFENGNFTLEFK